MDLACGGGGSGRVGVDGVALEKLGDFETHCLYTGCRAWHLGHLSWKVHDAPLGHLSFLVWKGMQKPVGRVVPSGVLTVLDDMGVVGDCWKFVLQVEVMPNSSP